MASLRKLFGKRLRYLRTEKGFNQLYLATLASVSEDFISLVERGINAWKGVISSSRAQFSSCWTEPIGRDNLIGGTLRTL